MTSRTLCLSYVRRPSTARRSSLNSKREAKEKMTYRHKSWVKLRKELVYHESIISQFMLEASDKEACIEYINQANREGP